MKGFIQVIGHLYARIRNVGNVLLRKEILKLISGYIRERSLMSALLRDAPKDSRRRDIWLIMKDDTRTRSLTSEKYAIKLS
jgi:hypothetical protein